MSYKCLYPHSANHRDLGCYQSVFMYSVKVKLLNWSHIQCTVKCVLCISPIPEDQCAATAWRPGPSISKLLIQIRIRIVLNLKIGYFKTEYVILILQNLDPDLVIQSYPESRSNDNLGYFKAPGWRLG